MNKLELKKSLLKLREFVLKNNSNRISKGDLKRNKGKRWKSKRA